MPVLKRPPKFWKKEYIKKVLCPIGNFLEQKKGFLNPERFVWRQKEN